MLPSDSILRRLPAIVQAKQRLRLEAIVFSIDLLTLAYGRMRRIAGAISAKGEILSATDRTALFSDAWTMVDQIHVLRQLFKDLFDGELGPNQSKFHSEFEGATLLRNRMDHLHNNVRNLATRKGMRAPLFGALSYFLVEPHQIVVEDDRQVVKAGTLVTITAGTVPDGKALMAFPNPSAREIHPPVSQFKLFAFDEEVDLEDAVKSLQPIVNKLSENIDRELKEVVAQKSEETGVPMQQLMATPALGELVLKLSIVFGGDTPGPT